MLDSVALIVFPLLMIFAAFSDLFTMTIPNRVSLLLIGAQGDLVKSCEQPDGAISVVLKLLDRSSDRGRDGFQDFAREA